MRAAVALRSRLVARARPQIACCAQQLCLSSDTKTANPGPNVTEMAAAMPRRYYEMSNTALLEMAVLGDQHAREERLIREIMAVDNVSWDDAMPRYHEMEEVSKRGEMRMKMPYYLGIGGFYFAGFASIPLCFHLDTVKWFNHHYVTTDVPEPADLETWLEVGTWAWNWMEPALGQLSFFILCVQLSKNYMQSIGMTPYIDYLLKSRATSLKEMYPQYHASIVNDFAIGQWYDHSSPSDEHGIK